MKERRNLHGILLSAGRQFIADAECFVATDMTAPPRRGYNETELKGSAGGTKDMQCMHLCYIQMLNGRKPVAPQHPIIIVERELVATSWKRCYPP